MANLTRRPGAITRLLLLVTILSLAAFAQAGIVEDQTTGKPLSQQDPAILQGRIVISPVSAVVALRPGAPRLADRDRRSFPIEVRGEVRVRVESILPFWGATVEALVLRGPGGAVPPDRLLVRVGGEEAEFLPLSGRVRLVTGDHRSPVEEVPIEILFCPTWRDRPGRYEGRLLLRPAVARTVRSTITPYLTASGELRDKEPGKFKEQDLGETREIEVVFESPQVISIELSSDELHFDATAGVGIISANEGIVIEVSTNAAVWQVECRVSPLVSDEHEIPVSRILWERLNDFGNVVDSGNLADQPVVFEGRKHAECARATLRFKVHIFMHDVAAVYNGTLSMLGTPGRKHREKKRGPW